MSETGLPMHLQEKVRHTILRYRMIGPGTTVVVGVSGGPDSVGLLHILASMRGDLDFQMVVAHLDHALRPSSAVEADFVRSLAKQLGIVTRVRREDVAEHARSHGISVEEAGRRMRYDFFEHVRHEAGAHTIATAHHRDDSVETFLLRIFRGSSITGLRGILPVRGHIIRPFVDVARSEILAFLQHEGIDFVQDTTNLESTTDRNFIRNRLVPLVTERFPGFAESLKRTTELIAEEEAILEPAADALYHEAVSPCAQGLSLNVGRLCRAPRVMAARCLRKALYELSGPETRWKRIHIEALLKLLRGDKPSAQVDLPGGLKAVREYGIVLLTADRPNYGPKALNIVVDGPVRMKTGAGALEFAVLDASEAELPKAGETNRACFDADEAPFPLAVRTPQPGDRIEPWGLPGSTKLKKLFIDLKIPRARRGSLLVVAKDDDILWIPGIRRSRIAPIRPETRRILEIRWDGMHLAEGGEVRTELEVP
ncbi:MAG: tRNA lysidine(34) synthetase TilS [Thermodesulfobacteriota bacterium]